MSLELQGTTSDGLLLALLLGVSVVLCAWGGVQLVHRRWRRGLFGLAAALGPAVAAIALWLVAAADFAHGRKDPARRFLLAGVLAGALAAAALIVGAEFGFGGTFRRALLAAHLAVAISVIYLSVYAYLGPGRSALLLALRLLAVAALLAILLKPTLWIRPDSAGPWVLPIFVDRSGSMGTSDEPGLPSRFARAVQVLQSQDRRLTKHVRPQWYVFATSAEACKTLADLADRSTTGAGTDGTNLLSALTSLAGRRAPLGALLVTDGIQTAPGDPVAAAGKLNVPVFSVAVGSSGKNLPGRANFQLLEVDAPVRAIVDHTTSITAKIRATHLPNVRGEVRLFEGDNPVPLARETFLAATDDETVSVTLPWRPSSAGGTGRRVLRVEVASDARESTARDNTAERHMLLNDPQIRVLYVEGAVRPEYKYLRRRLEADANVRFGGLVRIRENRFWAQGDLAGGTMTALPSRAEDFGRFDVLILGDLDRSFLTEAQMAGVRRFVRDGGGLLMLGGQKSFGPGDYSGTDIESALPVVMGPRSSQQVTTPFVPQLTAAGESSSIFAGITGYFAGPAGRTPEKQLAALPPLRGCVAVQRVKPAASVLAVHPTVRNQAGPLVVLAIQPFGAGRSAAFTADTTWRWFLPMRALGEESPYGRFWSQLIRYLAGVDTTRRQAAPAVALNLDRSFARAGREEVTLNAQVQGPAGQPVENVRVRVTAKPVAPDGETQTVSLAPMPDSGAYRAKFVPAEAGEYVLRLAVEEETGKSLGQDELRLTVISESTELENLARNDALLRDLAQASRGRYVHLEALPDLLDDLFARRDVLAGPGGQARVYRLYHFPVLFVLVVVLLTGEWLLRRKWQMA